MEHIHSGRRLPSLVLPGLLMSVAFMAAGCGGDSDDDGGEGSTADAGMQADAAPVGELEQLLADLQAFCDASAEARCEWALDCLGAGPNLGFVGLSGRDQAGCVEAASADCYEDVSDRAMRGTIDFTPSAVDGCVTALGRAPCDRMRSVSEWANDYKSFVANRCGSVTRGARVDGEECGRLEDCRTEYICASGACREATRSDLMQGCISTEQNVGFGNADQSCPGSWCVQAPGDNRGLCSINCEADTGACPESSFCITVAALGGAPTAYCSASCATDADCENGLDCVPINAGEPDQRHCSVAVE